MATNRLVDLNSISGNECGPRLDDFRPARLIAVSVALNLVLKTPLVAVDTVLKMRCLQPQPVSNAVRYT